MDSQKKYPQHISFEFFPAKTEEGEKKLVQTAKQLATLKPHYFSVTFGAGGSTRDRTLDTVLSLAKATGIPLAPHLSCIGSTKAQLLDLLNQYQDNQIDRLVALRGDRPTENATKGALNFAYELVQFVREHTAHHFHIEVAAYPEFHPEAVNPQADIDNLKRKQDAGADSAITQYFYNAEAYYRLIDACEANRIEMPIVPGIMPIMNFTQLSRFSAACGAEIPAWLSKRLAAYGEDTENLQAFGIEVVSDLCNQLLAAGCPGLHFYSMNQAAIVEQVYNNLHFPHTPT